LNSQKNCFSEFNTISEVFSEFINPIAQFLSGFIDPIAQLFSEFINPIAQLFSEFNPIGEFFSEYSFAAGIVFLGIITLVTLTYFR
jgi:hypothetical protein